jgi:hypothetical protein
MVLYAVPPVSVALDRLGALYRIESSVNPGAFGLGAPNPIFGFGPPRIRSRLSLSEKHPPQIGLAGDMHRKGEAVDY